MTSNAAILLKILDKINPLSKAVQKDWVLTLKFWGIIPLRVQMVLG